jgi:hypothetical protein
MLRPGGRKIDLVVDRGADNLYVEVKTVHPISDHSYQAWDRFPPSERVSSQDGLLRRYPGFGVLVFCGTGFAWRKLNLEDFADLR